MYRYVFFFLLFLPFSLRAQNTLYFMDHLPQSMIYNPAFFPDVDSYLGMPALSGVSAQVYNSAFNFNELTDFGDNISNQGFDADKYLKSLGDENRLLAEARISLISMGFRISDKSFLSFSVDGNSYIVNNSPTDIMYLFTDLDEIPRDNFPVEINNISMITANYMSIGATYSYKVTENLTLGISPKINFNNFAMETNNLTYTVEPDISDGEDDYKQSVSGKFLLGMFTEMDPEFVDQGDVDLDEGFSIFPEGWEEETGFGNLFTNKSLSLDLGATYKYENWMFSGSIINIGSSVFKSNNYEVKGDEEYINVKELDKTKFAIPTKIFVGAMHQFSPKWNYGILVNNTFYKNNYTPSATISLNGYVGKWLSTSASYTAGYKFDNLGIGLRLRFLPGTDLFMVTDNIIQAINYKNANRFTAAVGINMLFGMKGVENYTSETEDPL